MLYLMPPMTCFRGEAYIAICGGLHMTFQQAQYWVSGLQPTHKYQDHFEHGIQGDHIPKHDDPYEPTHRDMVQCDTMEMEDSTLVVGDDQILQSPIQSPIPLPLTRDVETRFGKYINAIRF
jgi:hypothetical protein